MRKYDVQGQFWDGSVFSFRLLGVFGYGWRVHNPSWHLARFPQTIRYVDK